MKPVQNFVQFTRLFTFTPRREKARFRCVRKKEDFLLLSLGSYQYRTGRVNGLCVCITCIWREHTEAQPKVVLEKPGIEPAAAGLQGLALIHYTTTASLCALRKSHRPPCV